MDVQYMSLELFDAIDHHDLNRVTELIKQDINLNVFESDWPHYAPLQVAIGELELGGSIEIVLQLIEHGADINAWDASHDSTPLLVAICRGQYDVGRILVKKGADPNVRSGEGDSPLRSAVEDNKIQFVELLLSNGANESINEFGEPGGFSALGNAARKLNISMVDLLLKNNADPNVLDEYFSPAYKILPPRKECDRQNWNTIMKLLKDN